jgi:hypothetical protein
MLRAATTSMSPATRAAPGAIPARPAAPGTATTRVSATMRRRSPAPAPVVIARPGPTARATTDSPAAGQPIPLAVPESARKAASQQSREPRSHDVGAGLFRFLYSRNLDAESLGFRNTPRGDLQANLPGESGSIAARAPDATPLAETFRSSNPKNLVSSPDSAAAIVKVSDAAQ